MDPEYAGIYLHARYFDPQLGTFLSADPIGPEGGINQYAYGFGDPINSADRSGLTTREHWPIDPNGCMLCKELAGLCGPDASPWGRIIFRWGLELYFDRRAVKCEVDPVLRTTGLGGIRGLLYPGGSRDHDEADVWGLHHWPW